MTSKADQDRTFSVEQSMIAALLNEPDAIHDYVDTLFPSHFANAKLGRIYDVMRTLASRGVAINPTSVGKEMLDRGHFSQPEDEQYLHELLVSTAASAKLPWCAETIREEWQKREMVRVAGEAMRSVREPGAGLDEVMDRLQGDLENISRLNRPSGPRPMSEDIEQTYLESKQMAESGQCIRGMSTGYDRLDWWTSGLQPSNLIVLAAQTGMGKTSLAMNIAVNAARNDGIVVIFSMEMGRSELAARLSSSETRIGLQKLTSGSLSQAEWKRYGGDVARVTHLGDRIYLDVSGRVTPETIRAHLRRLQRRHKVALVIVDYLQLCGTADRAESQYVKTTMISGALKAIAVDFEVPMLALSQLSREAARRGGEPRLSDLRDSGTIEQDANVVVFIHRDRDYQYGAEFEASIIVAKNRNGPTGKFQMHWNPSCVLFSEIAERTDEREGARA